jgi:hypothetical protein
MIFDYSPRQNSFDAIRGSSMHILRTLYISTLLYIQQGIG